MVSRAGLEPATTALKDQCIVRPQPFVWSKQRLFRSLRFHQVQRVFPLLVPVLVPVTGPPALVTLTQIQQEISELAYRVSIQACFTKTAAGQFGVSSTVPALRLPTCGEAECPFRIIR